MRNVILPLLLAAGCCVDREVCEPPCLPATALTCESHPFGPAIECGPEEEPQTTEKCLALLAANEDLCETEYVACREAMRTAPCGTCPEACEGIAC